jgi:hypothetical protein
MIYRYTGTVVPPQDHWAGLCRIPLPIGVSVDFANGFNHAMNVLVLWQEFQMSFPKDMRCSPPGMSQTGMRKSNLLGRMMRGESIRREPCTIHLGLMCSRVLHGGESCECGGTGWLPNDPSTVDMEKEKMSRMSCRWERLSIQPSET